MNPRAVASEGSLIGAHGSNQGNNNLTLKGWPLTGLDRLRSGILQQQNSLMQSPQSYNQLLQQQQLMLVQQNLAFPSSNDLDNRRMKMLLNNRNLVIGKDGQLSSVDVLNVGSPVQVGCSVLPRGDADMLMKLQQQQMQSNNQHQQPYSQHPLSDFNIVLEDQSGKKVELGSETWERRLSLFVTRRLLSLLTILLYSKSIWFGAISCSEISAGLQWQEFALKKTRKGIERAHGKDSSRVRLLQGGRYPELALYLRLELLEGVVAYHSGQYDKSRKVLTSAQEKFTKLQVPDEALSLVMSMGFKERDSKRALRMSNQDVSSAVDFLVEQKTKRAQKREEDIQRRNEIMEQKKYGTTPLKKAVDIEKLNQLVSIGFEKELAAESLRRNENDAEKALDDLTNPEVNSSIQVYIESKQRKRQRQAIDSSIESLVGMGFERSRVIEAFQTAGAGATLEQALRQLLTGNATDPMNAANNQSQAIPTAAADNNIPADAANDIVNSLVSRLDNADQNGEAGGPSATSEERDAEMEDALAGELAQGDAFSDYDLEVTEEGVAISEYLALLDSTGRE